MKGAQEKVSKVEELLSEIEPGKELPPERAVGELLEQIVGACVQLGGHLNGGKGSPSARSAGSHPGPT